MATLFAESITRKGGIRIRSQNGIPIIEETFGWIVQADHLEEEYVDVIRAEGLPQINVTKSAGGLAICRSIKADRREAAGLIYDVTAEFSSQVKEDNDGGDGGSDPTSDPTAWVPVYETKFERLQEVVTEDASGKAIVNSAGDPFETGLTRSRFIPIWEFYQFEPATVDDEEIIARNETVNASTFKGRAEKTLLLTVERSTLGFYFGQRRRLTRYSVKYNKKEWTHKRLDIGTAYIDDAGDRKPYEIDGVVILGALNGTDGQPSGGITGGKPVNDKEATGKLAFDMYDVIEFRDFLRT